MPLESVADGVREAPKALRGKPEELELREIRRLGWAPGNTR
jgi:hypothetical protein